MLINGSSPTKIRRLLICQVTLAVLLLLGTLLPSLTSQAQAYEIDTSEDEHRLEGVHTEMQSIAELIPQAEENLKRTEAKRHETEKVISQLAAGSRALLPELQALTADYKRKQQALADAISSDYKSHHHSALELMAESGTISETLSKATYRGEVQARINQLAQEADQARSRVNDRKQNLDNQRSTQEVLRRQLASLEEGITHQKAQLQELLENRTNEAAYLQAKIAAAELAQSELLRASLSGFLDGLKDGTPVKRGDIIGFEGSTGFSTGCHLHFSVIQNGAWVNPGGFWHELARPEGTVFQEYGMTDFARSGAYHGNIHNGIDYVSPCGTPIQAAADGVIVRDNRTDGSGFGHYIMIRHASGLITLYAHLL